MFTVYFDTCFYLRLGAATPEVAAVAIERINALPARPVITLKLVEELTNSKGPGDEVMLERVLAFAEPLRLECDFGWEVLGDPRDPGNAAENTRVTRRVEATRAVARCGGTREQAEELGAQVGVSVPNDHEDASPIMTAFASGRFDLSAGFSALGLNPERFGFGDGPTDIRSVVKRAGLDWDALVKATGLDALPTGPENAAVWTEKALGELLALFPEQMAHLETRDGLVDAEICRSTSLPDVALGRESRSAGSRFDSIVGDNDHISTFLRHRDKVDFLQLDLKRYRKMKADPAHLLRAEGVAGRCFAGDDVRHMVDALIAGAARK